MRLFFSIFLLSVPFFSLCQSNCQTFTYEPDVVNDFSHNIGEYWDIGTIDGWAGFAPSVGGYLAYGWPYFNDDFSGGLRVVNFELLVASTLGNDDLIFIVDIVDWTSGQILISQSITRSQFYGGITPQVFSLTYNHIAGHSIEYRVNWSGLETAAVTGMLITNDLDGDQMCDCFSDTNGDGVCDCFSNLDGDEICDEDTYLGCELIDVEGVFNTSVSFGGSNYYLSNTSYTWEEANDLATTLGGHLVTINSPDENQFLQTLATNTYWIGLFQNINSANYSEPSGGWEWVTGECLDYQNWNVGEPNNASEMENGEIYAHMIPNGTWNDWITDSTAPFIMEINCLYPLQVCEIYGCMDSVACNYDEVANTDDGSCTYFDECGVCNGLGISEGYCDCDGNQLDALGMCGGACQSDFDNDGVCDDSEVFGCTYTDAGNYNPEATNDDGSCLFNDCTIDYDNGYDAGVASVECAEDNCPGDFNDDSSISTADLLMFLGVFGLLCDNDPPSPICGNGVLELGEECDDGNNVDGDGCEGCIIVATSQF